MRVWIARHAVLFLLAASMTWGLMSFPAVALEPGSTMTEFTIASWGLDDGLPATRIWSIAEDAAGYLWIGTDAGLVRFDGAAFRLWSPVEGPAIPKGAVIEVLSASDGSIWVGQGPAGDGVSRISAARAHNYGRADLGDSAISFLLEDDKGTLWTGNADGLFHLQEGRWVRVPPAAGIPRGAVHSAFEDSRRNLWIGTSNGVALRKNGASAFHLVDAHAQLVQGFAEDAAGVIWVTDPVRGVRSYTDDKSLGSDLTGTGTHVVRDRRGHLWVATLDRGLWRVRPDERAVEISAISAATNWPNDVLRALHEDRHGNVWVGADSGLYRLTPRRVATLTDVGRSRVMASTPDGSTWIGTAGDLLRVRSGSMTAYGPGRGLPESGITALSVDRAGTLWIATSHRVLRFENERLVPIEFSVSPPLSDIRAIGATSGGVLWVYDDAEGLFIWEGNQLHRVKSPPELASRRVRCLYVDRGDAVWLSFTGGNVLVVAPDGTSQLHHLPDSHALVNTIYEDSQGAVWLGGTQGVSRFTKDGVVTVGQDRLPGYAVFSILQDDARNLWLAGALGVARMTQQEFESAAALPNYQPRYTLYDASDGLAGMPVWFGTPSAVRTAGELWFVTTGGVTVIDALRRHAESAAPDVQIDNLAANGRRVVLSTQLEFPPDVRNVMFEYSVPTLTAPTKVTFRHRLSGIDADWIDAGSRREVSYANLTPGSYRFDVVAVSSDHAWSESSASLVFSIRPMFYQTAWFYGACLVTLALMSWLVWRMRVRQLRRQFSVIVAERVRMSREIHDTLLQGMVAVALQLDVLAAMAPASAQPLGGNLVRLRKLVEGYIRETRDAIFDLRAPHSDGDLVKLLEATGSRIVAGTTVQFDVGVHGTPRPLVASVGRQLLQVAREAITNAVRHAQPRRIHVELQYRSDAILLRVADDGQGFDLHDVAQKANGHFGLLTMRERVQQIGGAIEVRSSPGIGTYVEAIIPMAVEM
jgi:signal transduction histidine kinase/ligand-binding sensor domain-containing protein